MRKLWTIDYELLKNNNNNALTTLKESVTKIGFLKLNNLPISSFLIDTIFNEYKLFFLKPYDEKNKVNMKFTNSNRGWGESKSEQVNQYFLPDLKEMYESGPEIGPSHKFCTLPYYAKIFGQRICQN